VAGSCEHGSIKSGKYLTSWVTNYIFKKVSAPWNFLLVSSWRHTVLL